MADPLPPAQRRPAGKKPGRAFYIAVIGSPLLIVAFVVWMSILNAKAQQARAVSDIAMVAEVDQFLITTLAGKGPDDPLIKRFGAFQQLTGAGHRRNPPMFSMGEDVTFSRTAVFARGSVPLGISIYDAGPLSVNFHVYPEDQWLSANPLATEIAADAAWIAAHPEYASMTPPGGGNVLVLLPNNAGASATEIIVGVRHPNFTTHHRRPWW
jgi:hypothetical protein